MKVLLFNGSPKESGCTYTALKEIADTLNKEGIETLIYHAGRDGVLPCKACKACIKLKKCVIDDKVNEFVNLMEEFDGLIIGSPVHYAAGSAYATSFIGRAFYSASLAGKKYIFAHKPGAIIASARRAGTTATLDHLAKYFSISQMPVISGRYWNMVHGQNPDEVKKDLEGMQNMRYLARNFAYHLKCKEAGKLAGIEAPADEEVTYTNFIRE